MGGKGRLPCPFLDEFYFSFLADGEREERGKEEKREEGGKDRRAT